MKYFVLGAIASGTLLYGFSIVYGVTGTLQLDELALAIREVGASKMGLVFGLAFIIVRRGVQIRRRAIPHVDSGRLSRRADACDVVHRFGAQDRFLRSRDSCACRRPRCDGRELAGHADRVVGAVNDMGNVVAISQVNLKRMLAYSTISHVGFILLGILAGTNEGYRAAMFYTLTYVIMASGRSG